MDWKQQAKNQNLVPRLELHDKKNRCSGFWKMGVPPLMNLPQDSIIGVNNEIKVKKVT